MVPSTVALVACASYDEGEVEKAVARGAELIGGIRQLVSPGENILLKPNILVGDRPDRCVTTHPSIFKAIARLLQQAGARVTYGDSPSFGAVAGNLRRAGLTTVADELGLELADFDHGRMVTSANPQLIRQLTLANGALDADGIVNLPKFKTHGLMRFTGAVKNLFGCVPGRRKAQYHVKLADPWDFASMLVDIYGCLRPRFSLLDGVVAMEGNGPRSGHPRTMGLLIFSADPVALDATACRLIGLDPLNVPTCVVAEKAGLGNLKESGIRLVGDRPELFKDPSFKADPTAPPHNTRGRVRSLLNRQLNERPVINPSLCNQCGTCVKLCPVEPKAVDWQDGNRSRPPVHDYGRCIRCYCCQETCPQGAISVANTILSRLVGKA
jgi:uncharacterized protein (DUF362 family)/ferredoxin